MEGSGCTRLLNVDLEVESQHDLQPVVDAFEPAAYSLERPAGRACFELSEEVAQDDPTALICAFVSLVNSFSPAARESWDRATRRVFDVGVQSGRHPFHKAYCFRVETLRAVASIGAEISVTVYAPE